MSKVGKWESGKVPVLLSHRNENKSPFILHFVRFSLSLTLSKILSLDNKNKKISFCFVLCSFIRIFASYKAITEDMNITRKIHKSLIYGRLRKNTQCILGLKTIWFGFISLHRLWRSWSFNKKIRVSRFFCENVTFSFVLRSIFRNFAVRNNKPMNMNLSFMTRTAALWIAVLTMLPLAAFGADNETINDQVSRQKEVDNGGSGRYKAIRPEHCEATFRPLGAYL